jgi:hypothetical protein
MEATLMKNKVVTTKPHHFKPIKIKRRNFKRVSPFLLLVCFIVFFWTPYVFIIGYEKPPRLFLLFGMIVYVIFADYFLWNLLEGKKIWLIWIIESIVSFFIIDWVI